MEKLISIYSRNYASADWLTIDLSISTTVFRNFATTSLSIYSRNYASADWLTIALCISTAVSRHPPFVGVNIIRK